MANEWAFARHYPQRTRSSIGSAGVATHLQSPPATLSDRPRSHPSRD
jgi:hypothetical protein